MSGALDFLFEGRPPPSTTTYGTTTTDMPKWLSDYTQGLIGKANAIAGEEYQQYGGQRLAPLTPDQQNAIAITRQASGNYVPIMSQATQNAQGALTQTAPFVQGAAQTFTGDNVSKYMNPYVENVINRAGTLAQRQLNEKFMPSVQAAFGAAGSGPRSTQMRRVVDQGVRDLTEGINEQGLAALSNAYNSAGTLFNQDATRLGGLAQTVGNLNLNAANVQGGLARTGQDLALQDAAAQAAAGETLQSDQQRSLDLAYQDFQNQRDYPKQQVDWLSSVIQGTPHATVETKQGTGPAETYQPSGASQLGSLLTTGLSIYDLIKGRTTGNARGGPISMYSRGRRVRKPTYQKGGALSYA